MSYRKISFPDDHFANFMRVARLLGHDKRGDRWDLLCLLLAYAEVHPDLFRKR